MRFDFLIPTMEYRLKDESDWECAFLCQLGHELKRRGYSVAFITQSKVADREMQAHNHIYFNLYDMIEDMKKRDKISHLRKEARRIEETYNINMQSLCLCQAVYCYEKPARLARKAVEQFVAIEDFLNKNVVKCFLENVGGDLTRRVFFSIGRKRGIPSIYMQDSTVHGHLFFSSDELLLSDKFDIKSYNDLTPTEIREAEEYITSFRHKKARYLPPASAPPKIKVAPLNFILDVLYDVSKLTYRKYIINKGQEPIRVCARLYAELKRMIRRKIYKSWIQKPRGEEKYFLFPLHVYRESQTAVRALQYFDQARCVELIASSLPYGYKLYTKEHPGQLGEIPYEIMRPISKEKNVTILDAQTHSHTLIESSSAVITINSTVGFEAIMYQKPVVVLGKPFYSGLGLTIDVENNFDLHSALREAVRMKEIPYQKVICFVNTLLRHSYKGTLLDINKQNIRDVTDNILSYSKKKGFTTV